MAQDDIIARFKLNAEEALKDAAKIRQLMDEIEGSVDDAGQSTKRLDKDFDNVAKSAKTASTNIEGVTSDLKKAERESDQLNKSLKEYEKTTNKVRNDLLNVQRQLAGINSEAKKNALLKEQKKLQLQLKENVQDMRELRFRKKQADESVRNLRKTRDELDRTNKSTNKLKEGFKNIGRFILAAFAVDRIIAGFRSVIKTISEYQSAVSELRGISQATDEQIASLTKTARDFAKASRFTATEVIKAQTELAKLGRTVEEIEQTTEAVLLLATAAGTDVANAAEVAAQTMNQFGIETERAGEVSDILARSFQTSALTIQRFQGAFKQVGTTANVVGASLEETTASIAALVDAGIPAEKAGTDLRNIYIALDEEGLTWNEAQERLLNSTDKLSTATDLFGRRSGAAGLVIAQNAEKIARLTESYENAEGAAQALADAQLDNLKGDQLLLASAFQEFILQVEEGTGAISNFARGFTSTITGIVRDLSALNEGTFGISNAQQNILRFQELTNKAREAGNLEAEKTYQALVDQYTLQEQQLQLERLTLKAKDDQLAIDVLNEKNLNQRVTDLQSQILLLEKTGARESRIEEIRQRILFLTGQNIKETEKENDAKKEGVKLSEEELAKQRELTAQRIALRVAEQERNNAIINDQLQAEIRALEEANAAAKEAGDENIRQREQNNLRLTQLNFELLQSDLKLAAAREEAKREEIALLNSIGDKTPAIQAQIFGAQTEIVALSRAVDDLLLKLADSTTNLFINPNLAPDVNFSEGIGNVPDENIEEQELPFNFELGIRPEDLAKRANEIVDIYKNTYGILLSQEEAYAKAVAEIQNGIAENRRVAALSYLNAIVGVFNQVLELEQQQGDNSRELALFTIALNTATAIAGAVSSAASLPFPANIPAIAGAISAVLTGISQARNVLEPPPSLQRASVGAFAEGTGYVKPQHWTQGARKDDVPAYLTVGEGVATVAGNKEYPGLVDAINRQDVDGWVNRYYGAEKLASVKNVNYTTNTTSDWSDKRMVSKLKRSNDIQYKMLAEMQRKEGRQKFKRAG